MNRIKVLVIDDSALMRGLLSELLAQAPDIEVVGSAPDPFVARELIKQRQPDVLTLDVEMPRMDGLTFLENLMRLHPLPVVMVSSLTARGAEVTLQALDLGAVDYFTKPSLDREAGLRESAEVLLQKVRAAARARVWRRQAAPRPAAPRVLRTTDRILAIGASTGGTEAIREVLEALPADAPGVVITQHIPLAFAEPFAQRLDRHSPMRVKSAQDGEPLLPGHAYVAPGDRHLEVRRSGARYHLRISDAPPENRHRPSVDVMFHSLAASAGPNVVAALLTGMGEDGARGLLALRQAGAQTLIQDEASSVVWGMPGAAHRLGAAERVLPLSGIAESLLRLSGAL